MKCIRLAVKGGLITCVKDMVEPCSLVFLERRFVNLSRLSKLFVIAVGVQRGKHKLFQF